MDNAPTKFVDTLISSTPASAVVEEDDEEAEVLKEKNNMIPILAGIASALIIAIIVLAIIFVPKLFKGTGAEIVCPKFIGMTIDEVKQHESFNSFDIEWEYTASEDYEIGVVCDQSQSEGKKLKNGAAITLYVSTGQTNIKVPDVYGKTESYAVSELKSKGFATVVKEVADDEVKAGLVVKTDPARTTVMAEGAEITVYVSTGKATKMLDVPNVVGLTEEKAKADIEKLGLVVQSELRDLTANEKEYAKGYVIAQEPDANSSEKVPEGTTIKIYVSTGVTNYTYAPTVAIRSDFTDFESTGYVSLWSEGKMIKESGKLAFSEISNYSFEKMTGTQKELEYTVKVRFGTDEEYYSYATIKVDASKDKTTEINKKNDYKKYVPKGAVDTETKICEECGTKLAQGVTHTDADHEDCPNGNHKKPIGEDCIKCTIGEE